MTRVVRADLQLLPCEASDCPPSCRLRGRAAQAFSRWPLLARAGLLLLACACHASETKSGPASLEPTLQLPAGYRLVGAELTHRGPVLWGHGEGGALLWSGASDSAVRIGSSAFRHALAVAEVSPGMLEILDTLRAASRSAEADTVGSDILRLKLRHAERPGIRSAAYASGEWRAIVQRRDSSIALVDPLSPNGDALWTYRTPIDSAITAMDDALVYQSGTHFLVVLRFFPFTSFLISSTGTLVEKTAPFSPGPALDTRQLVLIRLVGDWETPRWVLADPRSLRRIVLTTDRITFDESTGRSPILRVTDTTVLEVEARQRPVVRLVKPVPPALAP